VEVSSNEFDGFCLPKMACHGMVMVVVDDLETEVLVVGYVEAVSLLHPTIQGICGVQFLDHQSCKVIIQNDG